MRSSTKITLISVFALIISGCASLENMSGRVTSLFQKPAATDDPLLAASGDVSKSYKAAKRELANADMTLLKFARWSEDKGEHAEAKKRYQDIVADDPNNVDARLGIARVEFATGRKSEAVDILKRTAVMHPDNAQVWVEMGHVQSEQEQWGAAVQSLTKAVTLSPDDQQAQFQLGLALARSDRLDEAQKHLVNAVGESPALYNIGFILYEASRKEEAAHWFQRALDSHPDSRTSVMARRMLADLSGAAPVVQLADRTKSRVDMELTSYQAYRESAVSPGALDTPPVVPSVANRPTATASKVQQRIANPSIAQAGYSLPQRSATADYRSQQLTQLPVQNSHQTPLWRGPVAEQSFNGGHQFSAGSETPPVQPAMWEPQR